MKRSRIWPCLKGKRVFAIAVVMVVGALVVSAQNPELQQKVAEVKEAMAANKQALAQYTWQEQVTVSLKGDVKKQEHFQVRLGPDGKPQKQSLDAPQEAAAPSGGRLKQHVVEKKKDEYKDYVDQIKDLIQQYVPPEKAMLEQAAQQGNVALGPAGGAPGQYRLVLTNYVKPGDKMTLLFDKEQKALVSVTIASYLSDPKDAVNVDVTFTGIPGGPNHIASETIDGVSKQLTIVIANSLYQHL
jgi:23S rRNA pseudoU1915 N3-methylase RlmH